MNSYDLIVGAYDWGPGVDKIIIRTDRKIEKSEISKDDFVVKVKKPVLNWVFMKANVKEGCRKVLAAYPCNEKGERLDEDETEGLSSQSYFIALELSVHPDDAFSNPFFFSKKMMNEWASPYDYSISNKKLGLEVTKLNKRISPLADSFAISAGEYEGIPLSYASWKPAKAEAGKTPLIIWLHGMGEGGKDPYIAILGNRVSNLITDKIQNCFSDTGAIVLVPQADGFWLQTQKEPDLKTWASEPKTPAKSYYTKALKALIDNFVRETPEVDTNRIYIGGCSNGGYMTVNMIMEYPDFFAAAYPVCEAYLDSKITDEGIEKLAGQNIWFTHAKNDKTVDPAEFSVKTIARLKAAGAKNLHFSFFDDVHDTSGLYKDSKNQPYQYNGHWSWLYTLNNECVEDSVTIFDWLARQRLGHLGFEPNQTF